MITPRSSDLPLGLLEPGEYRVTVTMYVGPSLGVCTEGTVDSQTETTFQVRSSIPAVSEWGLIAMGLLLLAAGTICLRRRARVTASFLLLMLLPTPCALVPKPFRRPRAGHTEPHKGHMVPDRFGRSFRDAGAVREQSYIDPALAHPADRRLLRLLLRLRADETLTQPSHRLERRFPRVAIPGRST